jgi:hypothetical protein
MPVRSGAGSRLKAIEAISAGVPIVSTAFGVEGLGLEPGRDYLAAEASDQMTRAIRSLRTDGSRRSELVQSAFQATRARHSREALVSAIDEALAPQATWGRGSH